MANFAQLNEDNIVTQIIVVSNDVISNLPFPSSENIGIEFCQSLFGLNTIWKQTSYNENFRKNYAGIDYKFDNQRDAFISPQPYPSWILEETTCRWEPPVPYPSSTDLKLFAWDELTLSWVIIA
jgi:hypothetical protein